MEFNFFWDKYSLNSVTWFHLSLLLIVAVYFRFARVWTLRNLDLTLLLLLSPGLLIVQHGPAIAGHVWLFVVSGLILLRLFFDGFFQRRPRLEQNLNVYGLAFLCACTFAFLTTRAIREIPTGPTLAAVDRGEKLIKRMAATPSSENATDAEDGPKLGPTTTIAVAPVQALAKVVPEHESSEQEEGGTGFLAVRIMAVLAHLSVVAGLFVLGYKHFGNASIGWGMATLYLLLPCTAYDVDKFQHVLPAALIVWAFAAYRRPMVAGSLMGLACGSLFFPIFLLPLWATFYDRRGALRFGMALAIVAAVLLGSLMFTSASLSSFKAQTIDAVDWTALTLQTGEATGFWAKFDPAYRIPVFATFLVMLSVMTIWPRKKTFANLLAHSTAVIVGTQLWYPQQGGVYLLWYLPLLLLVVFRPQISHLLPPEMNRTKDEPKEETEPKQTELAASSSINGRLYR